MMTNTTHDAAGTLPAAAAPVPYVPTILEDVRALAAQGRLLTRDGEIVAPVDAADADLGDVLAVAHELDSLAKALRRLVEGEASHRAGLAGGELVTPAARITLGRPTFRSVSASAAVRVRDVLEDAAAAGFVPAAAVDKVAPLVPHVTPAALRDLIAALVTHEDQAADEIGEALRAHLPEQYRRVTVEPTR